MGLVLAVSSDTSPIQADIQSLSWHTVGFVEKRLIPIGQLLLLTQFAERKAKNRKIIDY